MVNADEGGGGGLVDLVDERISLHYLLTKGLKAAFKYGPPPRPVMISTPIPTTLSLFHFRNRLSFRHLLRVISGTTTSPTHRSHRININEFKWRNLIRLRVVARRRRPLFTRVNLFS